jgi:hypothetical protein
MTKHDLPKIVEEALSHSSGQASIIDVARFIWQQHEADLRNAGDLFFTWQYDMRWAATKLRAEGKMSSDETSPRGIWILAKR